MALFDNLFNEAAEVETDYLKDLPLAQFAENMTLIECGAKGLMLAEAGWFDICASAINEESVEQERMCEQALNEGIGDAVERVKYDSSAAFTRVKNFIKRIPELLKKVAQNIMGTINKFLFYIKQAISKDKASKYSLEEAKKGLERWQKANGGKKMTTKGFTFKLTAEDYVKKFEKALGNAQDEVKKFSEVAMTMKASASLGEKDFDKTSTAKADFIKALLGTVPSSEDSLAQSVRKVYGSDASKETEVNEAFLNLAVKGISRGYKDDQNSARKLYKASKDQINKWISICNQIEKRWEAKAKDAEGEKKDSYKASAKAVERCGAIMTSCSGIMSNFTGIFCSLLKEQYITYRTVLVKCMGYAAGGKAGDKLYADKKVEEAAVETTTENSMSLFGLDLI